MTNFEKWKANLKPENLIFHSEYYGIHEDVSMFHHEEEDCCWCCPARDKCRSSDPSKRCGECWLDWANEEAVENKTSCTAICVSNNLERFGGKYVAFMEWTGSVLCENAVFQAKFYKVPNDFDVKSITDEHHLEGLDGVEYVDSVQNFPHIPKFNLVHMAALMFSKIWNGYRPGIDAVVYDKDPEWRYV